MNKAWENSFLNKKVAVVGFGVEGLSSAKFFIKTKAKVTIFDQKNEKELNQEYIEWAKKENIGFVLGKDYLEKLQGFDLLVRSPGIKLGLLEKNKNITSNTRLFFDMCPCSIIGVTGTKGKGTTASLIFHMLKKQGKDVYLGGNIGKAPLDFLDNLIPHSYTVLELSSFQLQDLRKSPHIAVVLMLTSEHLDYHQNLEEYITAKGNILRFQKPTDFAVINRDYLASNESDIQTQGKVYRVSRERETDNGCFVKDKKIWVKINGKAAEIIDISEILIPGRHNLENVCAAVMVAKILKVENKNIVDVLKTFRGLEHRLELIGEVSGVKYYDDSFSTTPETAIAAIESFKNPEILILGGSSKNSDFTKLGQTISNSKNIKAIIGIGDEWPRIKSEIRNQKSEILLVEGAEDMRAIVYAAQKIAKAGDVVLLSPACASFGLFKDYKDRGEQFKREVLKLKS